MTTKKDPIGYFVEKERKIPVYDEYNVIVVGGSQSGVAAAICAARSGARVLLIERNCFLGGQSVATMVVQWEKRAFINHLGAVETRGIAKEMLERILEKGGSDTLWQDPPGSREMRDGEEWIEVEAIKLTLLEMCLEENIDLLFDTLCVGSIMEGTGTKVNGVIVENKSGRSAFRAKVVVDATAYLDVVWFALGEDGVNIRPVDKRMGPGWYTLFDGVDTKKFIGYLLENRIASGYPSLKNEMKVWYHYGTNRLFKYVGFASLLDQAYEKGLLDDWPEELALPFRTNVKWWGNSRWTTSFDSVPVLDALDAFDLTKAEIQRQKIDWIMLNIFRMLPGWKNAYICRTSTRMGLRETRILKAVTMLTRDDIFEPDHDRKDCIGRSGAHDPGKKKLWKAYPIPYGIMIPETLDGVICCSRTIGASDKTALDAHRGIVPTIVVGQAAGTAAALAVKDNVELRDVDLEKLRSQLRKDDVVLDVETIELDTIPERYKKDK